MKRSIKFTDEKNNLVELNIEIKNHFSISGNYANGSGQILDNIEPKTKEQEQIIDLWKKYHLKNVIDLPESIEKKVKNLSKIIEADFYEEVIKTEGKTDEELLKIIEEVELNVKKEIALACLKGFDLSLPDLENIKESHRDHEYEVQGNDYLIGTDEEMEICWDEEMDNYIEDFVMSEIPKHYKKYFDDSEYKEDCKIDGRAHSLARYDGEELEQKVFGENYYFYRQ